MGKSSRTFCYLSLLIFITALSIYLGSCSYEKTETESESEHSNGNEVFTSSDLSIESGDMDSFDSKLSLPNENSIEDSSIPGNSIQESGSDSVSSNMSNSTSTESQSSNESEREEIIVKEMKIEAETGILSGTRVEAAVPGYTGKGYVTGFADESDSVTITFDSETGGLYNLYIRHNSPHGRKIANLELNGSGAGTIEFQKTDGFTEIFATKINLVIGENKLKIISGWGWYDIDSIRMVPSPPGTSHLVENTLINPNASKETKELMGYIVSQYGKKIISGQADLHHVQWIKSMTGKEPALVAFDMMDYSPSRVEYGATSKTIEEAIQWSKKGGIVSIQWHWNAPMHLIDEPGGKEWYKGFMSNATTFDIKKAMENPDSIEYEMIIRDIDAIYRQLKRLRDEKIPVLWRPLHEAGGRWFWWGAKGPEACLKLYDLMYERMTVYHNLNNLIWVWSTPEKEWYPGNSKVDIIGYDSYPAGRDYSSIVNMYDHLLEVTGNKKIIAMTENGPIPDPDELKSYEALWSWFATWSSFVRDTDQNEISHLVKVYNNDYVITLDKLPWVN